MPSQWTETAANYVANKDSCPRCDSALTGPGSCAACGADLAGPAAAQLWQASLTAAEALRVRQALIDKLPTATSAATAPVEPPPAVAEPQPVAPVPAPRPERASSQLSVQSVLAVAGAGLFAVAAIVFTFFNPDLTDFATRTAIIAGISAIFMGGAWLLASRGLTFSAEAVGALGAVFLALDVWAFSEGGPEGVNEWVLGGIGMLVAATVLLLLAALVRLRTWLWAGLLAVALSPAPFAYSIDSVWASVIGHAAVGFAALAVHELARRFSGRFASPLKADHGTATAIQLIAVVVTTLQIMVLFLDGTPDWAWTTAAIFAALAALSWLGARNQLAGLWRYAAGGYFAAAVGVIPFAFTIDNGAWYVALVPAAAAAALATTGFVRHRPVHAGAQTVALATAIPAGGIAVIALLGQFFAQPLLFGDDVLELAAVLGLVAAAVGCALLAWRARGRSTLALSVWLATLALVALVNWSALDLTTRTVFAVLLAVVLAVLAARAPLTSFTKAPLVTGAHVALLLVAVVSWADPSLRVVAGAAVVVALFAVARSVPVKWRPLHVAVGYAYALVIVAAGLDLLGLSTIAVLCITTAVGSTVALGVTLVRRFGPATWYAILAVTAVPFAIGIVSVFIERSGWTALSTGVTFALLLAIMLTKRPGLTLLIRAGSAALLVPALAVVVISLGAQVLAVSASPITLPIIAVIVACTLPAAGLIAATAPDSAVVRVWIEVSALVTGAIAVVLALVRSAAGIPTTFLVLVILGIGAVATAVFAKRRYGWPVAGAAFTGALWCVWWLSGVTVLEPYLLPPALGTAVVAAILVARDRPGLGLSALGLFWTGLGVAAVPTLVALALSGSESATVPWRSLGLLASAVVFVVLAAFMPRMTRLRPLKRIAPLRTPLLVTAIVVASAGAIQGVRYGWGLDSVAAASGELVMLPVLAFAAVATLIAAVAARVLGSASRWSFAPALVYLVVGPIAAVREGWLPIVALLVLALALLALMIVTVARARTRAVTLPPVWFTFALAWCTAVASWSERELRVEAFSLPLGLALLTAGIIAMRPVADARPSLNSWPIGFTGSWRLLAPGIVVTLLPSILATGTDPRTERAILVIALALIAILIGSLRRLAAPFILGIVVLPIENVVVFAVQLGRNIGALPWWITLATAGAVLLVIAVGSERRTGSGRGAAARLRDLK